MAFVSAGVAGLSAAGSRPAVRMAAEQAAPAAPGGVSRRAALQTLGAAVLAVAAPRSAMADPVFNKGLLNLTKDNVVIDPENANSDTVLEGYRKVTEYRKKLAVLQEEFKSDKQMAVVPRVREIFEISALRTALNQANQLFDEETQKKTDAVVRGIIQDISNLENFAQLKPDVPRTPRRIEKTTLWMDKLAADMDKLLAFYPKE